MQTLPIDNINQIASFSGRQERDLITISVPELWRSDEHNQNVSRLRTFFHAIHNKTKTYCTIDQPLCIDYPIGTLCCCIGFSCIGLSFLFMALMFVVPSEDIDIFGLLFCVFIVLPSFPFLYVICTCNRERWCMCYSICCDCCCGCVCCTWLFLALQRKYERLL